MKGKKKFNIILALLIAIALWGYVFGQSDSTIKTTLKDVPISATNIDYLKENGLAIGSIDNSYVDITFSGKRSVTSKMTKEDFSVTYDVYGLTEGTAVLNLRVDSPDDITISDLSLKSIKIEVEQEETVEKEIFVNIVNDDNDKTEPYVVQLSRDKCMITGGKSLIERVDKVICELDAKKVIDEMQAFNVELIPVDSDGVKIDGLELSISNVSITAKLVDKKTVPLNVNVSGEENQKYSRKVEIPSAVTLKGDKSKLDQIESINAKDIDVSMIYKSCNVLLELDLPKGIMLASDSLDVSASVLVEGASEKELIYTETDILANGIMPNVTVTINEVEVIVKVFGPSNVIDTIKKEDIVLSVDASDLYWGTYELRVNASYNKNIDGIQLNKEKIEVYVE